MRRSPEMKKGPAVQGLFDLRENRLNYFSLVSL
jgi:hypothetical protein